MAGKDYYKILGVSRDAKPEQIKKAYRKLAHRYHPDHNKGDAGAESKFKEISEAYAVLSNAEKKRDYDRFGSESFNRRFSQEDIFKNADFSSIFREFGFGGSGRTIFNNIFSGMGSQGGQRTYTSGGPFGDLHGFSGAAKGRSLNLELTVSLEDIIAPTTKTVNYRVDGRTESVSLKIPAGMESGKKLRLPGKGEAGMNGGPNGDLIVVVKVREHPDFKRVGADLYSRHSIKFSEAVLGTEIQVKTIEGKRFNLKIPPGTQSNTKFRLKGHGLPRMKGNGKGDAYAEVTIEIPSAVNESQKQLVGALAKEGL